MGGKEREGGRECSMREGKKRALLGIGGGRGGAPWLASAEEGSHSYSRDEAAYKQGAVKVELQFFEPWEVMEGFVDCFWFQSWSRVKATSMNHYSTMRGLFFCPPSVVW